MYGVANVGIAESEGRDVRVTAIEDEVVDEVPSFSVATPKSSSFGPSAVSITTEGFRPPCVTP